MSVSTSSTPQIETFPPEAYVRMSLVLRVGLLLSLLVLSVSAIAYVLVHPTQSLSSLLGQNPVASFLGITRLWSGLGGFQTEAFLTLGILILLATPVARVLAGFYYFHRGGERTLAAITLIVFALILFGLFVLGPLVG